jgi:hypothetical protein
VTRVGDARRDALHIDGAAVRSVGAVHQAHEFGATRAEQARDPDDFAVEHVEVGGLEHTAAAEVASGEHGGRRPVDFAVGGTGDVFELGHFAAEHHGDELTLGEVGGAALAHELAVAQHRDAIREFEDLVEEVRDEQDGDAAVAQFAHDGEELLHLAAIEARGGLVEHEHL